MQSLVVINEKKSTETGLLLKTLKLRKKFYQRPFLVVPAPLETRLRALFYSVAICHQTYTLKNDELGLFGWDYLEYVFTRLMKSQDEFLLPGAMLPANIAALSSRLAHLFSPDGLPKNTSLDRLEERVLFLINLDAFIDIHFDSSLVKLLKTADGKLLNQGKGFYEILPAALAFTDPMKKKITFLLKLLEEAGLVVIADKTNFLPIMDYHMQRVLLRLGCVEITDPYLHEKLSNHDSLESDEEIRSACIESFRIIAEVSGHQVTKLNDFFWSLGRSCCNEKPLCQFHRCEKEPCTFFQIVDLKEHKTCAFEQTCMGFSNEAYRNLWQPMVETHYY
ncbi:MAG TPA: hypothetical protein VF298_08055 [Bacteroidales bacterium]